MRKNQPGIRKFRIKKGYVANNNGPKNRTTI